jgi:hypothetical protein
MTEKNITSPSLITEDVITEMIVNAAIHCRNKTEAEKRQGVGLDAFSLTFAMEVLTGKPKEECMDILLDVQKTMAEAQKIIENNA